MGMSLDWVGRLSARLEALTLLQTITEPRPGAFHRQERAHNGMGEVPIALRALGI